MISDANIYILTFVLLATKLANNCCRYGNENQSPDSSLARASLNFGTSHNMMEKERENLHEILDSQVYFLVFNIMILTEIFNVVNIDLIKFGVIHSEK